MRTLNEILLDLEKIEEKNPVERFFVAEQLGLDGYLIEHDEELDLTNPVFYEKHINQWLCTDTMVGFSVLYMDGEPIAVTMQTGRKDPKNYFWIGEIRGKDTIQKVFLRCVEFMDFGLEDILVVSGDSIIPETHDEFFEWSKSGD